MCHFGRIYNDLSNYIKAYRALPPGKALDVKKVYKLMDLDEIKKNKKSLEIQNKFGKSCL